MRLKEWKSEEGRKKAGSRLEAGLVWHLLFDPSLGCSQAGWKSPPRSLDCCSQGRCEFPGSFMEKKKHVLLECLPEGKVRILPCF